MQKRLLTIKTPQTLDDIINRTIHGDVFDVLPERCIDLLIADPPYNLTKTFGGAGGTPKDWAETATGNYRLTRPSNLWTD